ncbi:protein translocase subunit SecD [Alishewanella sp. SMS8]|uniref:protein translocase subunit SecD n=1 Tax=unclassified Alishewanella TaxID=2628974 RepID=UPI0027420D90|nr:protein translocase subunit SecD [Alishewanella sp. SMS8]MDP4944343.1 protein translocase subunit SecD [Alishewanella sp.]MDP5186982.1 protein translocase subunit SecD [Alishewanella sp.]MDP5460226.1 protein translocase subunit SecD [Alishewanella sp. SMS8]
MLNKNSTWQVCMVISLLLLALVYALPNLYPADPALSISATRGAQISEHTQAQLSQTLQQANIPVKALQLQDGQLLLRFADTETQLQAQALFNKTLDHNYVTALSLAPATPSWLARIGATPMKLGLDLRGGVHFLLAVDMQAAQQKHMNDLQQRLRVEMRQADIRYRSVQADPTHAQLQIALRSATDLASLESLLSKRDRQWLLSRADDGVTLLLQLSELQLKALREEALEQNITILRNRVNEIGVAEPIVQRQGADRIIVQLPGVQDTAQAKEILGATASLEFRLVNTQADIAAALAGRVPADAELFQTRDGQPILLEKRIMLTGDRITDASSGYDEYGMPQVSIMLDAQGGELLSAGTKNATGRRMASVFVEYKASAERAEDGSAVLIKQQEVINDATIRMRLGHSFQITGLSSSAEAQQLASLLRAGALIAPIQILEERSIGPSLGQENIKLGMQAISFGMLAVLLFMLVYYKGFGLVANVALLANVVLLVGLLSMIPGATLSLPGMAGIVLTVGMAVDANVLIFERIREELSAGRSVQQAIHEGYDRAFATIADSNITTLLVALILFGIGTGPVKGFAITLALGILTSIFTAVLCTRLLVNMIWGGRRVQSLSI